MFILTTLADLIQIHPNDFQKGTQQCISDNINAKYSNKVIQKIGLCVCLYDILSLSDGLIGNGDGLININAEFRIIVFRPFKAEVMTGRISSQTADGLRIRTPFFDDIFVPKNLLMENAYLTKIHSDKTFQRFLIPDDSNPDMLPEDYLRYDNQDTVRFRIQEEHWYDQSPTGPIDASDPGALVKDPLSIGNGNGSDEKVGENRSPYQVVATMEDAGLGPVLWWD